MNDRVDVDAPTQGDPGTPADTPPLGSAPPARPPLRRRSRDRVIAGVAGGLADYFDVSALGVRTLFGFAALVVAFGGLGGVVDNVPYARLAPFGLGPLISTLSTIAVFAYVVLWIVVPREDAQTSPAGRVARRFPRIPSILGVAALLAGAAVLGEQLGLWRGDVVWPLLLIAVGVMLFRRDAGRSADHVALQTGAGPPRPAMPGYATPGPATPDLESPVLPPPRPPRERSPLGWLGLGIALLVVGVAAVLQNLGAIELRLVRYPTLALVILGATMLVGTVVGRARWLVLPALLLVPVVLTASLITVPLEGGVGDRYASPSSVAAIDDEVRTVVGSIYLDLTGLQGKSIATPTITASSGVGEINVVVPFDAHVVATGRVGAGVVRIGPYETDRTVEATLTRRWEPRLGDGPIITLDLETGVGDIWVYRLRPTGKQLRELEAEER
jgi:phage shock protein PspC (stress-responsive transcriptional regulator)